MIKKIKPQTRLEKINFLKALQRGEVSPLDLLEVGFEVTLNLGPWDQKEYDKMLAEKSKNDFVVTLDLSK